MLLKTQGSKAECGTACYCDGGGECVSGRQIPQNMIDQNCRDAVAVTPAMLDQVGYDGGREAVLAAALKRKAGLIQALDLSKIMKKVAEKLGWTAERAVSAERRYRQFLYMGLKYPGAPMVPDKDIDEVWHAHILDTKRYVADCEAIFGRFIHHVPNYGERGSKEKGAVKVFNSLWQHEFGTPLFEGVRDCQSMGDEALPYQGPATDQTNCSVCVGQCDGDSRADIGQQDALEKRPPVLAQATGAADCVSSCEGCRTDCVGTQ